jgi:hypothetical protein
LDPFQANQDLLLVGGIASSTVLNCTSEGGAPTHTHTTSAIIMLSLACLDVIVQNLSTVVLWLGTDNTVSGTVTPAGSAFYGLQPVTSPAEANSFREAGSIGNTDVCRTNDMWMIGASGTALVSAIVL